MSFAKRVLEENDANLYRALKVLIDYDYVSQCEYHEEYVDEMLGDPLLDEDLPDMIEALREEGFSGTDEEAGKVLSGAINHAGEECGYCAKIRAE